MGFNSRKEQIIFDTGWFLWYLSRPPPHKPQTMKAQTQLTFLDLFNSKQPAARKPKALKYNFGEFKIQALREGDAGEPQSVNNPEKLRAYWDKNILTSPCHQPDKELLIVILLNVRGIAIGWHLVSMGGLCETTCHPREVLRPAIVGAAYSIALMHNHPGGDPTPSNADIAATRRIRDTCLMMQIHFVDHVIIGDKSGKHYSFRECGML